MAVLCIFFYQQMLMAWHLPLSMMEPTFQENQVEAATM
jgi:hypothetical protein